MSLWSGRSRRARGSSCAFLLSLFFATAPAAAATQVFYVAVGGVDDPAGGTPTQPWGTIPYALSQVSGTAVDPVELRVAAGSYGALSLEAWTDLLGGYQAGTWVRDPASHVSVIDGTGSFHAVTMASNSRLDGFTVTGGAAFGLGDAARGGGIFCSGQTGVVIANSIIGGNSAQFDGGGMYADACDVELRDNVIVGNWVSDPVNPSNGEGGGVRLRGPSTPPSTLVLDGNLFVDNVAWSGAAFGLSRAYATVAGNRLGGNRSTASIVQGSYLLGAWTNNEWFGNTLLGAGPLQALHYRATNPGDLRLVNNTLVGTDIAVQVDSTGVTEQVQVVNNIFYGYDTALEETDADLDLIPTSNLFFNNGVLFLDEAFTGYVAVNDLQIAVPEATGNVAGLPAFEGGPSGTWDASPAYSPTGFTTLLTNTAGISGAAGNGLAGWWVSPDTTEDRWFIIRESTATTLTVWGDASALGVSGASYSIGRLRSISGSAALDRGSSTHPDVPLVDLDGDLRPGSDGLVDIGVDEADPVLTPPADITDPVSQVQGLVPAQGATTFDVPYGASDDESGLASVRLFYRLGTSGAFSDFGSFVSSPISFTAPLGDGVYQFYTVATDVEGNVEATPALPDAETLLISSFSGTEVYVVPGGAGANNGSDWANALATPQQGLALAASFGVPEVWVAQGTYSGEVALPPSVAMYGSFVGTETSLGDRVLGNATVLDGGGAFHAVTMASNSRLDGFTVTGGAAFGLGDDARGGGIFCSGQTGVVVANSIIGGNSAQFSGGGMYADACDVELRDNVIVGNWVSDPINPSTGEGGGVKLRGPSSPPSTLVLDGNVFVDNVAWLAAAFDLSRAYATVAGNRLGGNRSTASTVQGSYLQGAWTNNEWLGNTLLGAGSLRDLRYRTTNPGDLRLVNNTMVGTGIAVEVDSTGGTEQVEVVNNILTGYTTALEEAHPDVDLAPVGNLFFDSGVLFLDEAFTGYAAVNDLQVALPEAIANVTGDPQFEPGSSFPWTDPAAYDPSTFTTLLTDTLTIPGASGNGAAGWWVNPDKDQDRWFLIKESTATTLTVWGDASGVTDVADTYAIQRLRLTLNSAALDRGSTTHPDVPLVDLDGDPRPGTDGLVDIGADEADPALTPPADTTDPVSQVQGLAPVQGTTTFDVPYGASDDESGLASVRLFYRMGTSGAFSDFGSFVSSPISFPAPLGDGLYQFYTVATDVDGNVEAAPALPDAETLLISSFSGTEVYVVAGGAGANNGSDWANALATPQQGLTLAASFGVPEVWVAQGTYSGEVALPPSVAMYGSFVGTETSLGDRVLGNATVLDGGGAFHAITMASNSRLDGFTVTGGAAFGLGDDARGGGIFCSGQTGVVVANSIIGGNSAQFSGGGMYADACDVELRDNVIVGNWVSDPINPSTGEGGGVKLRGPSSPPSTLVLDGNVFVDNVAWLAAAFDLSRAYATVAGNRLGGNRSTASTVQGTYLQGAWTNNEWLGNTLLGAGSLRDLRYRTTSPGDLRLVNNTMVGTGIAVEVDSTGGTEQVEVVNNILTGYATALEEAHPDVDLAPVNNLLFANGVDFLDEGITGYTGAAAVNAAVAGASGNLGGDPAFLPGSTGTWTAAGIHDPAAFQTTLFHGGAITGTAGNGLVGSYVRPDDLQASRFPVAASDATTVTVWGDAASLAPAGGSYAVETLHIGAASAARGAADTTTPDLPTGDIDGEPRPGPDGVTDIGSDEADPPSIGDRVWEDRDGDGLQDPGEPGMVSALVYLLDDLGIILDVTFTDANGMYRFQNLSEGELHVVRFIPPPGYVLTIPDQGGDEGADSDADPATGNSAPVAPDTTGTPFEIDAGMVSTVPCFPPDEAIYLYNVRTSTDGNDFPILDFMDFNQPDQVTGYNIYRSADPAPAPSLWPVVADDIVDGDEATPNNQWVDISGDIPPGGIWYYHVTAFNHRCPAEGPF